MFLLICLYKITLSAIDIDNVACLEPFYHSKTIRRFLGLICKLDLTLRHNLLAEGFLTEESSVMKKENVAQ